MRGAQDDFPGAILFAEEAYNLAVVAHDPAHPQVQEAAGVLIEILIEMGDYYNAERYAQVIYSNLRDENNGMNQESAAVAKGAYNLADAIYRQDGDLVKAEGLVRIALRLRTLVYGGDHGYVVESCCLLANILRAQKTLGDETRRMFERSLALTIKDVGPDSLRTACIHFRVGIFYYQLNILQPTAEFKQAQLFRAKFHH